MENLICSHNKHWREHLASLLEENGYGATDTLGSLAELAKVAELEIPDLLVVVHDPPWLDALELPHTPLKGYAVPTILAVAHLDRVLAAKAVAAGYAAFLIIPSTSGAIHGAVAAARHRFRLMAPLQEKVTELERKLAERKIIEKAKGLMMEKEHLTEEQAFRKMRNLAMTRRITLSRLAEEIAQSVGNR